jgi:tetratricopeptide (TPR) repeat protein/CHAT domain-containing protein
MKEILAAGGCHQRATFRTGHWGRRVLAILAAALAGFGALDAGAQSPPPVQAAEASARLTEVLNRAQQELERADQLERKSDIQGALETRQGALKILETGAGEEAPSTVTTRIEVANTLMLLGRNQEARQLLERALMTIRQKLGDQHPRAADVLNRMGEAYRRDGDYTHAITCYRTALQIIESLPNQEEMRGTLLNNLALAASAMDDRPTAEKYWEEAAQVFLTSSNVNPAMAAMPLSALGEELRTAGKIARAKENQEHALALVQKLPREHPWRLITENNYASVLLDLHQPEAAIEIYTNVVVRWETRFGPRHPDVLMIRRSLGRAYSAERDYRSALTNDAAALETMQAAGQTNHPLYGNLLLDMGDDEIGLGQYPAARARYEAALDVLTKSLQPNHSLISEARARLGRLMLHEGKLDRAQEYFDQAVEGLKAAAARDNHYSPNFAEALVGMAAFERGIGRPEKALENLERAFEIQTNNLDMPHPAVANTLEQVGLLEDERGHAREAIQLFEQTLRIRENALGSNTIEAAQSHLNISHASRRLEDVARSVREGETSEKMMAGLVGTNHILWAASAFNLANGYFRQGNLEKAKPLYQQALEILERQHSADVFEVAAQLSNLNWSSGNKESAVALARRMLNTEMWLWENVSRFGSESDRLGFLATMNPYTVLAQVAEADPKPLATAVLQLKGVVLESLLEDQQLARTAGDPDVASLAAARRKCLALEYSQSAANPPPDAELWNAKTEVERIESRLAHRTTALVKQRQRSTVTPEAVLAALPKDSVLLEFVEYARPLGNGKWAPAYGTLLFTRESLHWIPLGYMDGADGIHRLFADLGQWIASPAGRTDQHAQAVLGALHDRLWKPLMGMIPPGTRQVILAPDGIINYAPFAVFWSQDHFLGEDFAFRYVASGGDLLLPAASVSTNREFAIWADPQFAPPTWQQKVGDWSKAAFKSALLVEALRGSRDMTLPAKYPQLPGAREEGKELAKIASEKGWNSTLHMGRDATEAALRHSPAPGILHIASHGTFLPADADLLADNIDAAFEKKPTVPLDPMARSWVALVGANQTLDAWRLGTPLPPDDDGILTAEEAATMDLHGTWLVTLSACETAAGETRAGEGVYGLRRGFQLAGARHLLMTLWSINDQHTTEFMARFYSEALQSNRVADAMAKTQKDLLSEWRKTFGPSKAALWCGPFVLSSDGMN